MGRRAIAPLGGRAPGRSGRLALLFLAAHLLAPSGALAAPPSPPFLSSPVIGSVVNGTVVPFGWAHSPGALNHRLIVVDDFGGVWFDDWLGGAYIGIDVTGFPDDGTVFYWQIAAWNPDGTSWSVVWWFCNGPSAPPPTPSPAAPSNGANIAGTQIAFSWTQESRGRSGNGKVEPKGVEPSTS